MSDSTYQNIIFYETMSSLPHHCMLIKIINYDEFIKTDEVTLYVIDTLNKIVNIEFLKLGIKFNFHIAQGKIFLNFQIINAVEAAASVREIAFNIYSKLQLHFDEKFPKIHLNALIASLNFPEDCSDKTKIADTLTNMLAHNCSYHYYQNYQEAKLNFLNVKQSNSELYLLKQALKSKKIEFAYQPIVDRKTGEVPYYECLLRIPDENDKLTSIGPFIASAEANGLINVIDVLALDMAIAELVSDPEISLSVNISNYGILDKYLIEKAEKLLQTHKIAQRLIIEVTETILNVDYEKTKKFMDRLHKHGCRFALDDFGAGFTSFKQLQNLPIDIVKIDGSYIKDIISNHQSRYFVEALVKISEDLGIKTVAEFVENGEIAKFLIDIKVDGMQGNFFSPASSNKIS